MPIDRNGNSSALVLALDTCSPVMTMALADDREVKASISSEATLHHSKSLFSILEQIMWEAKVSLEEISRFAITTGPGSFTGLRVGLAAFKGLAQAAGKPLLGISTLEALARTVKHDSAIIVSLVGSPRGDVFRGIFDLTDNHNLLPMINEAVDSLENVIAFLQTLGVSKPVIFVGEGANSNIEKLRSAAGSAGIAFSVITDFENISAGWNVSNSTLELAPVIALQANNLFNKSAYAVVNPHYLRPSDAEIRS